MFQTAELGQKVPRAEFDRQAGPLRLALLDLQQRLRGADFPVIVLFSGVDGAGKGESVNLLNEWMDPRWIITRAYAEPTDEERERPRFWRYWRDLPPKGQIGLFLSAWYSQPVLDHVHGVIDDAAFDRQLDSIIAFEKMLADDGALILKFWMHLSREAQNRRLKALEKDPLQRWRVSKTDWANWKRYDRFIAAAEHGLRRSGTGRAPWMIVEGEDARFRSLKVLTTLGEALRRRLATPASAAAPPATAPTVGSDTVVSPPAGKRLTVLETLDLKATAPVDYPKRLRHLHARIAMLSREAKQRGVSTLVVFEGWDAAGKGGAIRHLTAGLDARDFRVYPFAAPTDEERAHHYLWRFWRHLPRAGRLAVFDRSWYGRVLVERVEGYATTEEWMRAYAEINEFESELVHHGTVLIKFWLHISKDEQAQRFQDRQQTPHKSWKLTAEDWRNREKWDDYRLAVNEMVEKTSARDAPWSLIAANDKSLARLKVLEVVADRLAARLG